ncbi:uncharacterized protein LOC128202594 isoform X2 [Galleria mellonella]|uniref:Uncharacterized protein LOC128202594 isoform X2 n=1 Tax=Galleria mellonella TaxID=7137 RepID=A0ABM3N754_GALME|nr:uncharacterized protein LOC128202594 isoform X2 [Galleria mellonella]
MTENKATQLNQLIKKRGTFKSKLTNFCNYINILKNSSAVSNAVIQFELQSRIDKMESLYSDFDTLQGEIEEIADDPDQRYQERDAFENQYYAAVATARSLCIPSFTSTNHEKTKWHRSYGELKEGTLVVIKEKTSPPLMWLMGRVIRIIPGRDGIARVADIQTKKGVIRRAYNTICPLPVKSFELDTSTRGVYGQAM